MGQCAQLCTIPIYPHLVDDSVGVELRVFGERMELPRGAYKPHLTPCPFPNPLVRKYNFFHSSRSGGGNVLQIVN